MPKSFTVAPPCQEEACRIQTCLSNRNFQEIDCQKEIKQLFQCCRAMYERGETSTACSKSSVVESRLEQWRTEEAAACDERKQRTDALDM